MVCISVCIGFMWHVFDSGGERAESVTSVRRLQKLTVLDSQWQLTPRLTSCWLKLSQTVMMGATL